MYWLQFQSRVRRGTEEPITYFLPTDSINPAVLFYYHVQENILLFALLLFLLHLLKHCNAKRLACTASVAQQLLQTPLVVSTDIYFEVMSR